MKGIGFLTNLTEKEKREIISFFQLKKFTKNEILFKPEDKGKVFLAKNGLTEAYQITPEGEKFISEVMMPGIFFGDLSPQTIKITDIYVEGLTDGEVLIINKENLFSLFKKYPALLDNFINAIVFRLRKNQKRVISLATEDVESRFLQLLMYLGQEDKKNPDVLMTDKLTHEHIAQMLGVSRQTITVTVNDLEERGVIKRQGKKYLISQSKIQKILSK